MIEDIAAKSMEHALMLMPVLLASLRDNSSLVVKQSIVSGTSIFYGVVEELSMQVPLLHLIWCSPSIISQIFWSAICFVFYIFKFLLL